MNVKSFLKASTTVFVSVLSVNSAFALPIDWSGVFGMDVNQISNTRRGNKDVPPTAAGARTGTQGVTGKDNGSNFQTYIFKLNPSIIVNDGVTLKGEFSSGYLRGGFAGDNSTNDAANSGTSNSYFFTTPAQRSALNVNQIYMELYADTALVKIGRMSKHYGLGIIFDNGADTWDRFLTMYDGVEATMKIGNFSLTPYYARIASYRGSNTTPAATSSEPQTNANGEGDVREMGLSAQYDNKNRDLLVSVLFAKRSSEPRARFYQTLDGATGNFGPRGSTAVTIIEPFITKKWNKLTTSFEASLQTGDYGNVYGGVSGNAGAESKINASAYIFESKYELNPKWDVGFNAGQISGDKSGNSSKFEAAYLHPNYQIAELMFRYNYPSFNEGSRSIFDSPISNARFFKLYGNYKTDKWTFKGAFIMANALETAKIGQRSYQHEQNYAYLANAKQSDDIGQEIDFGFDYRWNPNVVLSGSYGYWMVGDFYAFSNAADGSKLDTSSVHGGSLRATLEF